MDHYEAMLTRGGVREICAFMRSDDKPYVDNRPFQEQENSAHDELCGRLDRYRFDKETLDDILSAVYISSDTIEASPSGNRLSRGHASCRPACGPVRARARFVRTARRGWRSGNFETGCGA